MRWEALKRLEPNHSEQYQSYAAPFPDVPVKLSAAVASSQPAAILLIGGKKADSADPLAGAWPGVVGILLIPACVGFPEEDAGEVEDGLCSDAGDGGGLVSSSEEDVDTGASHGAGMAPDMDLLRGTYPCCSLRT